MRGGHEDEGPLGVFFEAARAQRPEPEPRLLAAVLADAAAVSNQGRMRGLGPRWPAAAAAMAASVALGFWLGAAGVGLLPEDSVLAQDPEVEAVSALEPDAVGFFALDWEG